ncbi:hypothetical protein N7540_010975 [Penicillium herquei]|nr:hypothetical protein N7540_010975 [Penicillium herquei]
MSLLATLYPNRNPDHMVDYNEIHKDKIQRDASKAAATANEGTAELPNNAVTEQPAESGFSSSSSDACQRWSRQTTSSSTESTHEEDYGNDETVEVASQKISRLAQPWTDQSTRFSANGENTFLGVPEDSTLNPASPNFKAMHWMKNLCALFSRDPERYPRREAGVSFRNLSVHGFGSATDYQKDVFNSLLEPGALFRKLTRTGKQKIQILHDFDGLVHNGEMLVVLGRPGSGCSTFLKSLAGDMNGIYMDEETQMNYQGISAKQIRKQFKGEAIYMAETDVHFPQLTVGDTLKFAALSHCPRNRIPGVTKEQHAIHLRDAVMAMLGLSHTINTKVGNDFIRGVSGGERKRVSIAEVILCGSPLQCWDNSTRGLDSANALEFCRTLNLMARYAGATVAVAIYQASQSAYDVFDKVTVLYEGRQIYFGPTNEAKGFFTSMGFECPDRQTTADFLTSLTSPAERIIKPGYEGKVPRTPDEFTSIWKKSEAYAKLVKEITEYNRKYPIGGESLGKFIDSRNAIQSKNQHIGSPYTISTHDQIKLCLIRGFQRLQGDASLPISQLVGNFIMALIIGSVFYNLKDETSSFYSRGALLFFTVLLNAFSSALEILTLYAQRPIVEKQSRYAMYHPFAEAIASMLTDMPYKMANSVIFNVTLYFMTNLRRTPEAFFVFLIFSFVTTLTMSMLFRTIAASSRTLSQGKSHHSQDIALVPAAILILGLIIYTGFTIPTTYMLGWSRWMNYVNPLAYGFESLMVNEFHNRKFRCPDSAFVPSGPSYNSLPLANKICSVVGAVAGEEFVDGDVYLRLSFNYHNSHKWRNLGIMFAFMIFLMCTYVAATEYITEAKSKGEILLFRRGHTAYAPKDVESSRRFASLEKTEKTNGLQNAAIQRQTAIFQWQNVCYDIKIMGESRRILDHVDGWVKPGTCTALMGVSGAGKTTLLDVLATRVTMGAVTGEMLVNGRPYDQSFQRKTGYVQQHDLHLHTTTVREALQFSAILRQPSQVSRQEKLDYVEEVIELLDMENYADAVVGVPGEGKNYRIHFYLNSIGLNVEQRKRLTIGVELVAKPQLLLFLDEPTSGLDSQTSWSILNLIDTLTQHGQAILCTIHQPSALLFQRFDRLLLLARGGKTVYFGDIGDKSSTLSSYLERNGAPKLPVNGNPAEWMLEVIGAAPGSHSDIDWPAVWQNSPERLHVLDHLGELKSNVLQKQVSVSQAGADSHLQFAAPFNVQLWECLRRVFSQYWRSPVYIYSKITLCTFTSLYIGFSFFHARNTAQGLQNQMFSIFMLMTIFGNLVQQILPNFCTQRSLYEARERPAKIYSWKAFMTANILVELPWNALMSVFIFICWYYPIGLYRNAEPTDAVHERGVLMWLLILSFLLFTSTFSHMIIAGIELAETSGGLANLLFSLCLIFCGVLVTPQTLPGFWIFMYRVSPFSYLMSALLSTGVSGTVAVCDSSEFLRFDPPSNSTCGNYMSDYISLSGGYLENDDAISNCSFCTISSTDTYLAAINSYYKDAWRNFALMWAYIMFNIFAAFLIYWLARVPKAQMKKGSS